MIVIQVQDGQSCLFWKDSWTQSPLKDQFLELFSAKQTNISVRKFWDNEELQTILNMPFSDEAFQQLNDIQAMMQQLHLNELNDKWKFSGGMTFHPPGPTLIW
jgi:hypothetical protein